MRRVLVSAVGLAVAACGGAGLQLGDVTPESVPSLEAQRTQHPGDPMVLTRLGVAYFRAGRFDDARAMLDSAVAKDPQNGIAAIYRGMTAEAQGDFVTARSSYQAFIAVARSRELKKLAQDRLALVGRRELEYQARQALAHEAELTQNPPEPGTIAVMPFAYSGSDEDLKPLSRGFAQLVVTDLAKSRQVRVLERERIQTLLDEMHLSATGRVDSATVVRSGRLLRASRVVDGTLQSQGNVLRADAAVVDVTTSGVAATANAALDLNRLFDMEKALVLSLFDNMGITLTPAERQAVDQRPTQNVQAFLAWSRGLEAEDRGDFAGAQELFNQATRLDPSFVSAQQSQAKAAELSAAAATPVQSVDAAVTHNASVETGSSGSASQSAALAGGVNNTTPGSTSAPTSGGSTTASTAPTTVTNPPPPSSQPSIPQTGTLVIRVLRP